MTATETTHQVTTSTAATRAGVTISTIRTWCRVGAVAAIKTAGKWLIDAASLTRRILIGSEREDARIAEIEAAANVIDLSVFKDAKAARDKAAQILIDRSLLPTRVPGQYLAVSSDGSQSYLVDTFEHTCTCKAFGHHKRCSHLVAAYIKDILDAPAQPVALIAA